MIDRGLARAKEEIPRGYTAALGGQAEYVDEAFAEFGLVLMSCVAALGGMLPMALGGGLGSEFRQSMGIGSVGGILVSTLVSPYFIPALCACIKRRPTLNGQYGKTRT